MSILDLLFFIVGIVLSVMDLKTRRVSLLIIYSYVFVYFVFRGAHLSQCILGIICNLSLYALCRILCRGGLGYGDIQYSVCTALFMEGDVLSILFANFISSFLGIIAFLSFMLFRKKLMVKYKLPFIPFMFAGSCITWIIKM